MSQITAPAQFNARRNTSDITSMGYITPNVVTGAKVVAIVQAGILLVAGVLMVIGGLTVLGIASVVEGGVRLGLAISLRRGARRVRIAVLVICGISAVLGWTVGGFGIIGAVINLVIVRCLVHDEAKEFFNA